MFIQLTEAFSGKRPIYVNVNYIRYMIPTALGGEDDSPTIDATQLTFDDPDSSVVVLETVAQIMAKYFVDRAGNRSTIPFAVTDEDNKALKFEDKD